MWEKYGEFDSAEELNRAAAAQREEGDREALIGLALENGLDQEDAECYLEGEVEELATPSMATEGKLKVEAKELELAGILSDWKDCILGLCMEDEELQRAVRRKGKRLLECLSCLLKYAFEHKHEVNPKVVAATKVKNRGREEPMRGPVYLGYPDKVQTRRIIREYYKGEKGK